MLSPFRVHLAPGCIEFIVTIFVGVTAMIKIAAVDHYAHLFSTFWGRGVTYILFGALGLSGDPLRCESAVRPPAASLCEREWAVRPEPIIARLLSLQTSSPPCRSRSASCGSRSVSRSRGAGRECRGHYRTHAPPSAPPPRTVAHTGPTPYSLLPARLPVATASDPVYRLHWRR